MTAKPYPETQSYPKFEPNQILTADQLNQLAAFLEEQGRLARACLGGAGIVCGLRPRVETGAGGKQELFLTEGCGVTTDGYLVRLRPEAAYTHYRAYKDPAGYGFFGSPADPDDSPFLFELLQAGTFDPDDTTLSAMPADFLDGKILVAYLEIREVDLATCTGDDCDEKGIRIDQSPRLLALADTDLQRLEESVAAGWGFPGSRYREEFGLPPFRLARAVGLCRMDKGAGEKAKGKEWTATELARLFNWLITASDPGDFREKLELCYQIYKPLLKADFPNPPFAHHDFGLEGLPIGNVQYLYDWLRDMFMAYNEFTAAAFDLTAACGPERPIFPRHLVLGEAPLPEECKPSRWRQEFLPSPVLSADGGARLRVRSLFARLVHMSGSFSLPPVGKQGTVRVTPSRDGDAALGDRAIPFYYSGKGADDLRKHWNFDLHRRCRGEMVFSYARNENAAGDCLKENAFFPSGFKGKSDFLGDEPLLSKGKMRLSKAFESLLKTPERRPLLRDIEGRSFFRIEGHLGQSFRTAYAELSELVSCFNLPFQVTGVKLGSGHGEIDLDITGDCRFEDLEAIYLSHRSDLFCVLDRASEFFQSLNYNQPEPLTEPSERPKVTTKVFDKDGEPMVDAVWTVTDAEKQPTKLAGRTRKGGRIEIQGLEERGRYHLDIAAVGYQGKSIRFDFPSENSLVIKDIHLRPEQAPIAWRGAKKAKVEIEENEVGVPIAKEYARMALEEEKAKAKGGVALGLEKGDDLMGSATRLAPLVDFGEGSIGYVLTELELSGEKMEALGFAENFLYKHYPEYGETAVKVVVDQILYPMQLSAEIQNVRISMPPAKDAPALGAFDEQAFLAAYANILDIIKSYRVQLARFLTTPETAPYSAKTVQQILSRLDDLEGYCIGKFREFLRVYRERREALQKLHLFSVYACKHPGLEHLGGVPRGGTFVLVYGENSEVMFDFALPYLCSSDCPPVTLCLGTPMVFKLPKESFCTGEDFEYKFIASPPGGVVTGAGVRRDERTGDHYFQPTAKEVKPGIVAFQYHTSGGICPLSVLVEEFNVQIRYEILEMDADARTARVAFVALPEGDQVYYAWDFGGGAGASTRLAEHTFSTAGGSAGVALSATRGDCVARTSIELAFRPCDATFTSKVVSQDLEAVTYEFNHSQEAKTRTWAFEGVEDESVAPNPRHTFRLGEKERAATAALAIEDGVCTDTFSATLILPARRGVQIGLPEAGYCKDDSRAYRFMLDPQGGTLVGKGIKLVGGAPHFIPALDDVPPGKLTFTYSVPGATTPATLEVEVIDLVPAIRMDKPLVDPVTKTARVQFHADPPGAKYQWIFGDGKTSTLQDPLNVFDLSKTQQFEVVLAVSLGKCAETVKQMVAFEVCNADFTMTTKSEGNDFIVVFEAVRKAENTTYTWTLGKGEGQIVITSPVYTHKYKLLALARTLEVGLVVTKAGDVCSASTVQTLDIPALAAATVSLEKAQFAICDKSAYKFSLNPAGGTVTGPGVRPSTPSAESYGFSPSLVGTASGEATFIYTAPDGRSAAFKAFIHKPVARFSLGRILRDGQDGAIAEFKNQSEDADTYQWTFTIVGGPTQTSTEENPPAIRFPNVDAKTKFLISLSASWNKQCPSSFTMDQLTLPQSVDVPGTPVIPGGGGVRPGPGILVPGGGVVLPSGIVGNLEREKAELTRVRSTSGLPAGDSLLMRTESSSSTLSAGLERFETQREFASGSMNDRLAASLGGLIEEAFQRIGAADTAAQREMFYGLLTSQILQLINAVSVQEQDLRADDPLFALAAGLPARLKALRRLDVKLDPRNLLAEALATALEAAQGKPNVTGLWRKFLEALDS